MKPIEKRTVVIGMTGGVGAGKSTVLDFIKDEYDAVIFKTDEIAHDVMEPGGACYGKLREMLPSDVFDDENAGKTGGAINRKKLAAFIFEDEFLRDKINSLVHPAVGEELSLSVEKEKKQNHPDYVIIESALYTGGGFALLCDEVWNVTAAENVRVERLVSSRGYTAQKAADIIKSQFKNESLASKLPVQIDNSGAFEDTKVSIKEQLDRIWRVYNAV